MKLISYCTLQIVAFFVQFVPLKLFVSLCAGTILYFEESTVSAPVRPSDQEISTLLTFTYLKNVVWLRMTFIYCWSCGVA